MKTKFSRRFLFCRRRSQIMVFEGIFKFSACSSAGGRCEELPNRQAQDRGEAKPVALASSIILRHGILANAFRLNIFDAFWARAALDWPEFSVAEAWPCLIVLPEPDLATSTTVQPRGGKGRTKPGRLVQKPRPVAFLSNVSKEKQ